MRFAWPNDWIHQTKRRQVLEGLRQLDDLEGILLLLSTKFNTFTSGRLPLFAAPILSGENFEPMERRALKADPTQRLFNQGASDYWRCSCKNSVQRRRNSAARVSNYSKR